MARVDLFAKIPLIGMTLVFLAACMTGIWWIFKTGYKLKT